MPRKKPEAHESERHIYIREVAEILDRRMATLRKWEQLGVLPEHLRPQRGQRGWRYWTESQVEGLKEWVQETERWPGKGLPYYNPTEEKINQSINSMRKPRKNRAARPRNPSDARARIDPSSRVPHKPQYALTTKKR
jgi:transposase